MGGASSNSSTETCERTTTLTCNYVSFCGVRGRATCMKHDDDNFLCECKAGYCASGKFCEPQMDLLLGVADADSFVTSVYIVTAAFFAMIVASLGVVFIRRRSASALSETLL